MKLIFTLLLATLSTFSSAAFAQDYPNRPIKLIVPFPPAGGTDNVARLFVQEVSQRLGQTVVIENRAGAAGVIGADLASKAEPDGYTLLMTTNSTHVIGPLLNPKTPYSPVKSFTPIIYLVHSPSIMIVPLSSKATTVSEFIALAKANPGKLNYGSAGIGGIPHLSGERFQALSGTKMTHVPYKGTALAVPDLLAGRLDVIFDSFSSGYPHVRDGKARALGVSSAERSPLVPNLPAISEQLPGFVSLTWFGVLGPAGLPAPIVDKVNAAFNAALNNPKIREQLAGMGIDAVGGTPAEFVKRMADDTAAWSKVIADAKITLDEL
ncbi:tripartite tricarboxylate transporter substrate binding protein [Alcaligenaceae bacterium LF4-65]|uniref:Tripartite tricarboxylate transporter substrate binding protein n=1 Tax=Zwartia hollandica TaxID=324606 RepID=A0A953NCE0_9BURK|nr:tripartite tricarboxylate transporter substrate binding protein [Zwartia hollandica]MBZ1351074.1 tripartite tricarboxylate transporter substrate binding protein [Zwartia hollandica]